MCRQASFRAERAHSRTNGQATTLSPNVAGRQPSSRLVCAAARWVGCPAPTGKRWSSPFNTVALLLTAIGAATQFEVRKPLEGPHRRHQCNGSSGIHGIDCANGIHAFACAENVKKMSKMARALFFSGARDWFTFVLPRRQVIFRLRGFLPAVPGAGLFFLFSWSSRWFSGRGRGGCFCFRVLFFSLLPVSL